MRMHAGIACSNAVWLQMPHADRRFESGGVDGVALYCIEQVAATRSAYQWALTIARNQYWSGSVHRVRAQSSDTYEDHWLLPSFEDAAAGCCLLPLLSAALAAVCYRCCLLPLLSAVCCSGCWLLSATAADCCLMLWLLSAAASAAVCCCSGCCSGYCLLPLLAAVCCYCCWLLSNALAAVCCCRCCCICCCLLRLLLSAAVCCRCCCVCCCCCCCCCCCKMFILEWTVTCSKFTISLCCTRYRRNHAIDINQM